MPTLSRADTSVLGRWWWTVDRWTLFSIGALIGVGYVMMLAASPAVAVRIGEARDAFILKQVFFLAVAGLIVVAVSLLSPRGVRRVALAGCALALALTAATLVVGVQIKGAQRWIALPGFSVQPSEFLKPCFAVVAAWLIAEGKRGTLPFGSLVACAVYGVIALLLQSQPDIGMLAVVTGVFALQLFVAGLNLIVFGGLLGAIAVAAVGAFIVFPHVQSRIERFLHPAVGDHYQITRAMEAFGAGGLLGRGPGEGHIKDVLPDAHADFVFAVAGEEFGMVLCLLVIGIFAYIVLRGLLRLLSEGEMYVVLAATGLIGSFGLQAFVNMGSTLHLIPTKGMTLPFISYGGSSAMAIAFTMGLLLALTRRRGPGELL